MPKVQARSQYQEEELRTYYDDFKLDHDLAKRGKVFLFGTIDHEKAERICKVVELAVMSNVESVRLYISCEGGDLFYGMSIYEVLRAVPVPVVTFAVGGCFSAAALVLQAGDVRIMSDRSWLMLHEFYQDYFRGTVTEFEEALEVNRKILDDMIQALVERSKVTAEWLKERIKKRDFWLRSSEAYDMGFVDMLVPSGRGLESLKKLKKKGKI
ncbi:MAG: ATP-dependent Clp protease proteolytic subunit [Sulfolobales archaeon]|nr:ATP-dependent Clp protease proteolytic subunit [Sulfolobales archaeon]